MRMANRQVLLLLTLLPTVGRTDGVSAMREQGLGAHDIQIEIVFDGTPLPPKREASAMREIRQIWARYGVDVHRSSADAVRTDRAVRLAVTVVDHDVPHLPPGALGSIGFVDEVPEPAIAMYPGAIDSLVSNVEFFGRNEHDWPAPLRDLLVGRVMGRALAHEIGHFLLRTTHHSTAGLMRAQQPVTYLVDPDPRRFLLSSDEVTRLVSSVSRPHLAASGAAPHHVHRMTRDSSQTQ